MKQIKWEKNYETRIIRQELERKNLKQKLWNTEFSGEIIYMTSMRQEFWAKVLRQEVFDKIYDTRIIKQQSGDKNNRTHIMSFLEHDI